jgi:hypothetical protein
VPPFTLTPSEDAEGETNCNLRADVALVAVRLGMKSAMLPFVVTELCVAGVPSAPVPLAELPLDEPPPHAARSAATPAIAVPRMADRIMDDLREHPAGPPREDSVQPVQPVRARFADAAARVH